MLQVRTGSQQSWNIDFKPNEISIDGEPFSWDLVSLGEGRYHLLWEGRSYSAELLEIDAANKQVWLKLNGQRFELQAKDKFDLLLEKLGMSEAASNKINEVKAPMPGLIVDIRVTPGQAVQKGDALLVLEAMKMENILKSPGDGVVSAVKVNLRDNVNKGQVLVQFA
ncbi:biotin/lipoyl-containing protein [Solirubrum puertoriconensis]|uniref:Acetyl-CoA carboxylase biotin carboxyl carrier protein subunit n=1 Tax=Solirubrum puertoriconensis TaxID=1751427 RepID=A0A9X0HIB3_SOLP1|nr:biotin/lipoyl-containing protein [Solirubrum puertoriconensis]KUG06451.1 acetyl-CoA carboxylase biotin carboxyl carrier protein subunit [Solirubrum puertoriconensis]